MGDTSLVSWTHPHFGVGDTPVPTIRVNPIRVEERYHYQNPYLSSGPDSVVSGLSNDGWY